VLGPTGSGKEVVAQQIHRLSQRAASPFVDVNCSSIPENLIEAELFGHERGAFTGAVISRTGHFGHVENGTLFLDEIGDLPLSLQPKLLRVLEARQFRSVGSSVTQQFEGRIIAATHRDLCRMVSEGTFREDLYYRLSVFTVNVPPLDLRKDDIPLLVRRFAALQSRPLQFGDDALQLLMSCTWPGNVRQLRNLVDRVSVLVDGDFIDAEALQPFLSEAEQAPQNGLDEVVDRLLTLEGENKISVVEHLLIDKALRDCGGNKTAAARLLGVNRKVIERHVQGHAESLRVAERLRERARTLLENSDYLAVTETLRSALSVLRPLPPSPQERRLRFDCLRQLALCKRTQEGWLSAEALEIYSEAIRVGRGLADDGELNGLMFGTWTAHVSRLDLMRAREIAEQMRLRGVTANDFNLRIDGCLALANTLFWLGEFEETLEVIDELQHLPGFGVSPILRQGMDPVVLASMVEGLAAYQLGLKARAENAYRRLCELCRRLTHSFSLAIGYQGCAWIACVLGYDDEMGQWADRLLKSADEHHFQFYHGVALVFSGYQRSQGGDSSNEVVSMMRRGFQDEMAIQGGLLFQSFYSILLCRHLLARDRFEEARTQAESAIRIAMEHRELAYLAELLCVHGKALAALGNLEAAEDELRSAISTAAALGSVPAREESTMALASILKTSERISIGIAT
jgi:tetratricopeptide (TPR) repeat protein